MRHLRRALVIGAVLTLAAAGIAVLWRWEARRHAFHPVPRRLSAVPARALSPFQSRLLADLKRQAQAGIRYQDGYFPGGDPPPSLGVCTDVVIRSFRAAGVDLQRSVAEDVRARPGVYHIARPDPDIDHRRCRNLIRFFARHAQRLPTDGPEADWQPGDVVFWSTRGDGQTDHVGMIADGRDNQGQPTIIHHWPGLPVSETDGLLRFPRTGHFRWRAAAAAFSHRAPPRGVSSLLPLPWECLRAKHV